MALTKSLSFSLRRKRVLISSDHSCNLEHFSAHFHCFTPPMKKVCALEINLDQNDEKPVSLLESLPQELLIKVVCGVDHDDLKQLFFVSKTVRDSALIAKKCHFAYSTPSKTKAFRNSIDMLNNLENSDEFTVPKAPKPSRRLKRRRIDRKTLGNVAVALFSDEKVHNEMKKWPRRSLFMDIDS